MRAGSIVGQTILDYAYRFERLRASVSGRECGICRSLQCPHLACCQGLDCLLGRAYWILTQAISVNPRVIGSASGLYGFTQMAVGGLCTALAGLGHDPALTAASVLAIADLAGQLSFWIALRWQRRS